MLDAVLVPREGQAFKVYVKTERGLDELSSNPGIVAEELLKARPVEIDPETARSIIEERMKRIS